MAEPEAPSQDPQPNPPKAALADLLTDVVWATGQVPGIQAAIGQVGDGAVWRDSKARRVHDHTLVPLAEQLRTALRDLEDAVRAEHASTPAKLPVTGAA